MITDGTKLKRLFLKCYSEGKNAAMAFNDAAKECEEMQREIADTRILLAALDIKERELFYQFFVDRVHQNRVTGAIGEDYAENDD